MGAVTALMHADRDPSIAAMILDSPFTYLKRVAKDLMKQQTNIPGFVTSFGLLFINKTIKNKAKFNINSLNPVSKVNKCHVPALFVHGE